MLAANSLIGVGWVEGFEPSATGTTIRRSTKLSYTHRVKGTPVYQLRARRFNFVRNRPVAFRL
jgi:hypothetical protein